MGISPYVSKMSSSAWLSLDILFGPFSGNSRKGQEGYTPVADEARNRDGAAGISLGVGDKYKNDWMRMEWQMRMERRKNENKR